MKVLLVEDEEFIRDLFKRQLDLSGFATDAFANGQDGLAAISKNAYDLVLLDIMLPDINGLQILQNIRSNPATKSIAVVLLTNLGQDAVIKQGFELGADGYLVKAAYTPDQIVQEVKNIMQKKMAGGASPSATPSVADTTGALAPTPTPTLTASDPQPAAFPGQAPVVDSTVVPAMPSAPLPQGAPAAPAAPASASEVAQMATTSEQPGTLPVPEVTNS